MRFFRELMIAKARADGYPAGCIHRSKNYGRTNDDADRDRIIDLSGTGTDIQLYNFGYAGNSGFGLYAYDFTKFAVVANTLVINKRSDKLEITSIPKIGNIYLNDQTSVNKFKIKVVGLTEGQRLYVIINNTTLQSITIDGIYNIERYDGDGSKFALTFRFYKTEESCNITIEQIPDYQGALVSDGVDDYGLCENFPILSKDRGYTVFIIRKILTNLNVNACYINQGNRSSWSFVTELFYNSKINVRNWSTDISVSDTAVLNNLFVYQNSKTYNGVKDLTVGNFTGETNLLNLFSLDSGSFPMSVALYALEIYDHDLTDEEIQAVKARMIREYEEGTELPYDETGALIADYEAYDKSNDDEDRDILADRSGNGHDIQLYNFGWVEESGYNTTTHKGALVSDGVDDYGLCKNFPILPVKNGFTVIGISEFLTKETKSTLFAINDNPSVSGSGVTNNLSAIALAFNDCKVTSYSSGNSFPKEEIRRNKLFYITSESYNGKSLTKGTRAYSNLSLLLFTFKTGSLDWVGNIALYTLKIYNRDLTDEEIAVEKAKMIKRYEEKTGNKYVES